MSASESVDPDIELVRRWSAGDRAAGDRVIRRHFLALRKFFILKIADVSEREDLVQETLKALLVAVPSFEGRSSFKAFLFGIARNKLYTALKRRYRVSGSFDPWTDSFGDVAGRSVSSVAALRESSLRLLQLMAELPLDEQLLLELSYWHDMPGPEVARALEVSHDVVRARLVRTRRKLAERLSGPVAGDDEAVQQALERSLRALGGEL